MVDYKVRDLSLAAFGRKEIQLAEHEMPGLIAIRREYWGLSVLLAGLARGMLTLGFCFATRGPETLSRPLFLSASASLLLLLVAEVVASIKILSALERSAPGACDRNPA